MHPVKVSVIMAAYNVERYIDEAIQSVLAQEGVPFELLIGDDASTDGTWNRMLAYRSDPRVQVLASKHHRGVGAMRNRLIALAGGGPHLSICDADDVMLTGNLRTFSHFLDRNPPVGVVFGTLQVINGWDSFIKESPYFPGPSKDWDILSNVVSDPGTMFRREVFSKVGGYREGFLVMPDYDLFLRLAEVAPIHFLGGGAWYAYRRHPDSNTHRATLQKKRREWDQVIREALFRRYGASVSW